MYGKDFFMRVITGTARGRKLVAPEGMDVRPTGDKVKEAVFSAIQFDIEGSYVLDLFAGSGQMGIEALSRGAEKAVFVDSSKKSVNCVSENIKNTGFVKNSVIVTRDSYDYIRYTSEMFDIIILDPPYRHGHIAKILPLCAEKLNEGGSIICEYEKDAPEPVAPDNMILRKVYSYGKINVAIFIKPSEEESE